MIKGTRIDLLVDGIDSEGAGTGTVDGRRVHVAFALPGERVTVAIDHLSPHGRAAWGRLIEVLAPSPSRVPTKCAAWGRCGGCVLQHLDYPAQLEYKGKRVAEALAAAGIRVESAPCVGSPNPLAYRDKSKLTVARAPAPCAPNQIVLGAYAPRSHEVIDLAGCAIAEPPLDVIATVIADLAARLGVVPWNEASGEGDLRNVVLRVNFRGEVLAVLLVARRSGHNIELLAHAVAEARHDVIGVVENLHSARSNAVFGEEEIDVVLHGAQAIEERVGSVRLRLSSRAFFQLNRGMAVRIYADVAAAAALTGLEQVIDVYSGVGGIAMTLAARSRSVIGVEEHPGAVADAIAAADLNDVTNARFHVGDAARLLGDPSVTGERADVVVLNPPRKGCAPEVLAAVAKLGPRSILYLSCSPPTLARDLSFLGTLGYGSIRAVTPYDMLPHTPHVEALAVIDRDGSR